MSQEYSFRQFVSADLDLVSKWLSTPDVAFWYPDPDYIDDLEEHLEDERICQSIVLFENSPFAYVQDYEIHGWDDHHLSYLPKGARGLDTFIGSPDMLGKGHGTGYLRVLANQLFANGVPALGIDPNPKNRRAIRAYQNIGFRGNREIETEWGSVKLLSLLGPNNDL